MVPDPLQDYPESYWGSGSRELAQRDAARSDWVHEVRHLLMIVREQMSSDVPRFCFGQWGWWSPWVTIPVEGCVHRWENVSNASILSDYWFIFDFGTWTCPYEWVTLIVWELKSFSFSCRLDFSWKAHTWAHNLIQISYNCYPCWVNLKCVWGFYY